MNTRRHFLALVSLAAAGCSGSSSNPPAGTDVPAPGPSGTVATAPAATKKKIGFSTLTLGNPFFRIIADSMTAEATRMGYEVVLVDGEQDVNKQTAQVEDFITQGVAAIVLNPCDSKGIGTAIRKANEAGIPVFTNDIKYDGTDGTVVCHIATDNLQGGRLAGEAMVKLIGETGGKIAIIDYPDVESCQLRVKGFREVIETHNGTTDGAKIEIATTLNGRGAREAGHSCARDAIQAHPDLVAIFAINDPSALGARVALEDAGKADAVSIIGFDGAPEGKQAILDGRIVCDPIQFPERMGSETVVMIDKYFRGDDLAPEILIPSALYYQENARQDPSLQKAAQ
jgi:ribose transport system substrate-binding protein